MTPTEREIYAMHLFNLGDDVVIAETSVVGQITGVQFAGGGEDLYRVLYTDSNGCPHESWWRSSLLEAADEGDSNVICFAYAKAARERPTFH